MSSSPAFFQVRDLTIRYGGLVAVNSLSFDVHEGEVVGIIGPNGAGKTTAFNAIAGVTQPTSGTVSLQGIPITGLPPEKVARRGVGRTFQSVRLFRSMSVLENVAVAAIAQSSSLHEMWAKAEEIVELMSMTHLLGKEVDSLPLADQKRIEIARALATGPHLLLLDEMMSGLTEAETEDLLAVIKGLNSKGLTIIVIEHVLGVIMRLSHRVLVLDHGELIAEGDPQAVMKEPAVVEAYLGRAAARRLAGPS